jgi:hypothetical protein
MPTWTVPQVSFKHILLALLVCLGYPTQWEYYTTTFHLAESWAFLKSINSWHTASVNSHFFWSIWQTQNIWWVLTCYTKIHIDRVSLDRSRYHRFSQSQKPLSVVQNMVRFYDEKLPPCLTPQVKDHSFSYVWDCLFNIVAVILHMEVVPPSTTLGRIILLWHRPIYVEGT